MKRKEITKANLKVIESIASKLPALNYHTYKKSKLPGGKWRLLISWIQTRRWPNGEFVLPGRLVEWLNIKFLGCHPHEVNHDRRLRKRFKRDGMPGVMHYLRSMGVPPKLVQKWILDFEKEANG